MTSCIDDFLECPVCWLPFDDAQKLPCDHSLCIVCVKYLTNEQKRIQCPLCRSVHDARHVKPDFRLEQFLTALTAHQPLLTADHPETAAMVNSSPIEPHDISPNANFLFFYFQD